MFKIFKKKFKNEYNIHVLNVEIVTCVNQSVELLGLRLVGFNQFKCKEIGYIGRNLFIDLFTFDVYFELNLLLLLFSQLT